MVDISNEIDTVLGARGYTVPVTTPAYFVSHLGHLNALGTAALVEGGMFPSATGPGETPHSKWLQTMYENGLKRLRDGELPLDLARSDDGAQVSGYATTQTDYDEYPNPVFRKESSDLEF